MNKESDARSAYRVRRTYEVANELKKLGFQVGTRAYFRGIGGREYNKMRETNNANQWSEMIQACGRSESHDAWQELLGCGQSAEFFLFHGSLQLPRALAIAKGEIGKRGNVTRLSTVGELSLDQVEHVQQGTDGTLFNLASLDGTRSEMNLSKVQTSAFRGLLISDWQHLKPEELELAIPALRKAFSVEIVDG